MKNIISMPGARIAYPMPGTRVPAIPFANRSAQADPSADDLHDLFPASTSFRTPAASRGLVFAWFHFGALAALCLLLFLALNGCGGGYPGLGLASVSASATALDAGQTIQVTAAGNGALPIVWTLSGPACSGAGCGTLSSTTGSGIVYTAPPGVTAPLAVTVMATVSGTGDTQSLTLTVNPDPSITATLPSGTVGLAYSGTVRGSGGTGALTLAVASGSLPAGLTFNPGTGVVSGIPTVAGVANFVAQVTDSSATPFIAKANEFITITAPNAPLTLLSGNPPNGVVGTPYTTSLTVSGGTAPYVFSLTTGALPLGLTLSPAGVISGTPTTPGISTFIAQVQDGAGGTALASFGITVLSSLSITVGPLPNGTVGVPYNSPIGVAGGLAPYACTVTAGTLPAGLSLGAGCVVSGTPTAAGTANLMVKAIDSSNPVLTTTGPVSLTISPAGLSVSTGTLPAGTVGTPYSSTIGVAGGTSPYSCTVTSGTLPAGLALGANCLVSGTPTAAGTVTLTVKATDASSPVLTATGQVVLTINPAPLAISTGALPGGTVGTPYSAPIGVTGGTAPFSCTITSGALQAGLTLGANCLVSGTPAAAGTVTLMVQATDSANPALMATGAVSLTVSPAPLSINPGGLPDGTVAVPYSSIIGVSGGTAPFNCTITSGTLQAGLTLGANCLVSGTPTASGTVTLGVQATDSANPALTATGTVSLTIHPATVPITFTNPPAATTGAPYTGVIPVTGGTGPYTCSVAAGSALPAGLSFSTGCTLTGTPTDPGTTTVQVTVIDSANPPQTQTGPVTVTVGGPAPLAFLGTLPNAVLNQPFTQTLTATGGVGPYTYAVTAGALPAGLTLNGSTGTVSGTPTAPGASSFTITATDSESTPQTAPLPLTLLVVFAATPNDALLQGPYAFLFQGYDNTVLGVLAYQNATVGSFTADGAGALTAGELDTNHQGSNPTGATVPTNKLLGTYTLGSDDRGTLVVSTFNADGSVADTTTYAIAVKAPVSPATTTVRGSMIESNDGLLAGQRGTGTFLQQTATAFSTGLSGSYAFGLQGDTPCFPACTANLQAGPVATVGQITTASGGQIGGETDTNTAQINFPMAPLSGTYGAADTNGRVQLSLTNPNIPYASYPSDFAVYMVNANQALVMSTDKHSAYILLAGSMTSQTAATFSNASLSGQYVGYENAPTNPGLAGVALQNVINLSTATIFQGTANSTGTCTTNYVEQGGTTALINGLSGQGSGSQVLNALLGTYASTGNSDCTVGANGRAVINYPIPTNIITGLPPVIGLPPVVAPSLTPPAPRVAYLTDTNAGYFLETGYAGLGNLEQQTGQPFSLLTLNGTYVYGTTPAAAAATLDASGSFTANGAGQASYIFDESVLAGTLNVVTLGVTGSGPYALPDAQNGRFTFGTDVIFAISPTRFVLVDKSALTTSPSVALIY